MWDGRTTLSSHHVHGPRQEATSPAQLRRASPYTHTASCYSNFAQQEPCQIAFPENFIFRPRSFYFEAHNKPRLLKENIPLAAALSNSGRPCSVASLALQLCSPPLHAASYRRPCVVCCIAKHTQKCTFTKELHHLTKAPTPQG